MDQIEKERKIAAIQLEIAKLKNARYFEVRRQAREAGLDGEDFPNYDRYDFG